MAMAHGEPGLILHGECAVVGDWEGRSACEKWTRRARGSVVLHAVHSATLELVVCVCAVLAVAGAAPVRGGVPCARPARRGAGARRTKLILYASSRNAPKMRGGALCVRLHCMLYGMS